MFFVFSQTFDFEDCLRRKLHTLSTDSDKHPNDTEDIDDIDAIVEQEMAEGIANPRSQVDMFSKEFDVMPTQNVNTIKNI